MDLGTNDPAVSDHLTLDEFLAAAREKADHGAPVSIRIRDLLGYIDAKRRGTRVTDEIQGGLGRYGLATRPPFTTGWIDTVVQLSLTDSAAGAAGSSNGPTVSDGTAGLGEPSLTVSSLESASATVVTIEKTQDLSQARALMLRHDYSQLAVMSGQRQLVGAVSWQSMAIAAMCNPAFTLTDATVTATQVEPERELISLIPTIAEQGFVFVIAPDRTLAGIVTTADLSRQFATLAKPFLLIGEIERALRRILSTRFDVEEFADARDPGDTTRAVESVSDLTIGEIARFLANEANWARLHWPVDRREFTKAFEEVRDIRNDVMHFTPDPLSTEQDAAVTNFLGWLNVMERVQISG